MSRASNLLNEAVRYTWNGQEMNYGQLAKHAIGKDIFTDGNKWMYNLIMSSNDKQEAKIFPITKDQWHNSKLKDMTPQASLDNYYQNMFKQMTADAGINVRIDLNTKIKQKKITDPKGMVDVAMKAGLKHKGAVKYEWWRK